MPAKVWGPLVGPLVGVISFVCSIGNVPLAAVLWNGGISFGGVVAFSSRGLDMLRMMNRPAGPAAASDHEHAA